MELLIAMEWGITKPSLWDEIPEDERAEMIATVNLKRDMNTYEIRRPRNQGVQFAH